MTTGVGMGNQFGLQHYLRAEDEIWFQAQMESEKLPQRSFQFVSAPQKWHPVVSPLRKLLLLRLKEDASKGQRARVPGEPDWDAVASMNYGLLVPHFKSHCLRVSGVTVHRALAVANAVLWAADSRGCKCSVSTNAERFEIHLEQTYVSVAIRERQSEGVGPYGNKVRVPTDRLALVMERQYGGKFEISDEVGMPMQERLQEIFPKLYQCVVSSRVQGRFEREREELRLLAEAETAAAEERAACIEAARTQETSRRVELIDEAQQWRKARDLHGYIDALEKAIESTGVGDAHALWLAEARQLAECLDPVAARMQKLCAERK